MKSSGIIYYHEWNYIPGIASARRRKERKPHRASWIFGIGLMALALGGLSGPLTPMIRMEVSYSLLQTRALLASKGDALRSYFPETTSVPKALRETTTVSFNPLIAPDGSVIDPIDREFGLVVPKIGINSTVIPAVNPTNPGEYQEALEHGVAHASTSYFPDGNGTVYLFSHSTSYDWFVKDINAVFYLIKNLEPGDTVVVLYKGDEYTYKITDKKVVSPQAVSYLVPHAGHRNLILQTCWPPGSVAERLLIFADLVESPVDAI